ncbi:uncharacterized protein [Fopius arisanus]|uniref:Double jelly roll-like domain-containing protein n=1 Tax=Fopius arisanus TaxID=64838 RepID=A0A9R1U933_9HYME|nr:PREDICTED: uncharacterized protein LOC105271822 [Fopius arisanus]
MGLNISAGEKTKRKIAGCGGGGGVRKKRRGGSVKKKIPLRQIIQAAKGSMQPGPNAVMSALKGLSATGALAGGAAGIAKAVNTSKHARAELEESKRHNGTMESIALGFAEDYQRIVVNAKHELILTCSHSNFNAIFQANVGPQAEHFKITITQIDRMLPYTKPADTRKVQLLNQILKDRVVPISFRSWELYEYPLLPSTTKHVWTVKCSMQLEKPRYVIFGFQVARKNQALKDASAFDHSLLYDMYTSFQASYYHTEPEPRFSRADYLKTAPLIVIDCSKQNEFLKIGPVAIRLEFESSQIFDANTAAYCLILHDRIIESPAASRNLFKK